MRKSCMIEKINDSFDSFITCNGRGVVKVVLTDPAVVITP